MLNSELTKHSIMFLVYCPKTEVLKELPEGSQGGSSNPTPHITHRAEC